MSSRRAKTIEEYVGLIDQAIFETEEMTVAAEYDMESMGNVKDFVGELDQEVRKLRTSMEDGSYRFENKDLPFMEIVNKRHERFLPFKFLLRMINDTHREGLDVDEI